MSSLRITLRPGERIFVNGAVLRVERKTTLEFLNDVTFLLEGHIMQAEDAITPLRQLYFVVQMMLMDPHSLEAAHTLFRTSHAAMVGVYSDGEIVAGLNDVAAMVSRERAFDALKRLRVLIPLEDAILAGERKASALTPNDALLRLARAAMAAAGGDIAFGGEGHDGRSANEANEPRPARVAAGGMQ